MLSKREEIKKDYEKLEVQDEKIKAHNKELLCGLEELGLSKYESSIYYNSLGKGLISAMEIAYCSNVPRTKIYFILKKLEKKKLVIISAQKPLMFRSVAPSDAFKEIIEMQETKLNSIQKIVSEMQFLMESGLKKRGYEERKYFIFNQYTTNKKIIDQIKNAKETIDIMINPWGNQLLKYTKEEILKAIFRGIKVRIIIDNAHNINMIDLPNSIDKKVKKVSNNMFIFDNNQCLVLDNFGTGSAFFQSKDIFFHPLISQFIDLW